MGRKSRETICHPLTSWASDMGYDPRTVRGMLSRAGVELKKGEQVTANQIKLAFIGEKEAAEIREKTARAEKLERENKIEDGQVATLTEILAWMQSVLLPIRQRLLALAGQMAHRCNPTDPAHAQTQLDEWVKETLPLLREEIGKAGK